MRTFSDLLLGLGFLSNPAIPEITGGSLCSREGIGMTAFIRRHALSTGAAAALLAGCGGSQPPVATQGTMQQGPAIATHADRDGSWMLPEARAEDLIYVSNWVRYGRHRGYVTVYSYATRKLVGKLTGFSFPSGLCVDKRGDVFVSDSGDYRLLEYGHGGTKPIQILRDPGQPNSCSVDAQTGDLAVANGAPPGTSSVAIYKYAMGTPKIYAGGRSLQTFYFCAYDNEGNLFVDGTGSGSTPPPVLAELRKHTNKFIIFRFDTGPGGIMWDSKNDSLAFGVSGDTVDDLLIAGKKIKFKGETTFAGASLWQFWLEPWRKVLVGTGPGSRPGSWVTRLWHYPLGGKPIATIKDGTYRAFGVTVSSAK